MTEAPPEYSSRMSTAEAMAPTTAVAKIGHSRLDGPQLPAQVEHEQGHRWPHDVELLLDGERPHVRQRRGLGGQDEVVAAADDEVPVGHVEQGRERVEPEVGELPRGGEHLGVDGHPDQHDQQGGQQPAGPAGPELAQPDGQPLGPLAEQQRGDQEPRQDEEDVDGEESPLRNGAPPW